jgi:hypothetical protein
LSPTLVSRDGAYSQSPYFARGFVLVKQLHTSILLRKIYSTMVEFALVQTACRRSSQLLPVPGGWRGRQCMSFVGTTLAVALRYSAGEMLL